MFRVQSSLAQFENSRRDAPESSSIRHALARSRTELRVLKFRDPIPKGAKYLIRETRASVVGITIMI